jgi:hypothetical protein
MQEGKPVLVNYEEYYPPNVTACIFFLKNRMPDKWRDRHEQVLSDPNGGGAFDQLAVEIARRIASSASSTNA